MLGFGGYFGEVWCVKVDISIGDVIVDLIYFGDYVGGGIDDGLFVWNIYGLGLDIVSF